MRSFRLDPDSVADFLDSWPILLLGGLFACLLAYLSLTFLWARIVGLLFWGVYVGVLLRGNTSRRLREQYPECRHAWLLSTGLTTSTIGVISRMAFPRMQHPAFDLTWLGVSFFTILAFVIANRKNKHVIR